MWIWEGVSRPSRVCAAASVLVGCLLSPSTVPAAVTVGYRVVDEWHGGFQGEIVLRNDAPSPVPGWQLGFDLDAAIDDIWGGVVTGHTGTRHAVSPASWNQTIPAGGSISVGFVARQAGGGATQPWGCTLDGAPCTFGGGPAPTATPPGPSPQPTATPPGPTPQPTAPPGASPDPVYLGFGPSIAPIYEYGRALQMAWAFYEAQRSGPLPRFDGDLPFHDPDTGRKLHAGFLANRLPWRGDSDLEDGADVGLDLTGGWHDAGDHVKFGLPMAFSASFLAWGVIEFEDALAGTGQLERARDNLRWVGDYFIRAHPEPDVLYGQVGEGGVDHSIWGAPEVMPHVRPAWKIDRQHPGPDLAAQTSSALAAISLVFRATEPVYADALLAHAVELYDFAQATRQPETSTDHSLGRYSDSIADAQSYYPSVSGAQDDLPWAAAWLYRATGDARFLADAEADYTRVAGNTGHTAWTAVWDDVRYGLYVLMAEIAAGPDYLADSQLDASDRVDGFFDYDRHAKNFLRHWLTEVPRTPAGMAWLSGWASARYNTVTAFLGLVYRKHLVENGGDASAIQSYLNFATEQVNYVLGDNPLGMSYVVGFGEAWSQVAHHRAAHGSTTNDVSQPAIPRFVLWGGLAGGPTFADAYTADRNEFALTEVATDMNAGITGALAGLVDAHGVDANPADPDFPPPPPAYDEVFARARLVRQQPETLGTQVEVTVVNETAYPPRRTAGLVFRYFFDVSELAAPGDVAVDVYRDEGAGVSAPRPFAGSTSIYYVEGSFVGTGLVPIGEQAKRRTIEFLVRLPWGQSGWNPTNDPSYAGLGDAVAKTSHIAVYDTTAPGGPRLVWGTEPLVTGPSPTPAATPRPSPSPTPTPSSTAAPTPTPAPTATAAASPTPSASPTPVPGTSLVASVVVESQWQAGYCAGIAVTNRGTVAATATTLRFRLPASVPIDQSWNGRVSRAGDTVTVALPSWAGAIRPGETQKHFGLCAPGSTLPVEPVAL